MSFESALQRVQELGALVDSLPQPAASAARPASDGAAFAAALQQRLQPSDTALPSNSLASGLPTYGAAASPYATGNQQLMSALPASLRAQLEAAGLGPYLTSIGATPGVGLGGPVGQRIVALAQGEVGVREAPPGSNESTRIREYRSATAGAYDTPGPWCAYFVSWLGRQAGAPVGPGGNGLGYVPTLENWGRQTGRWLAAGMPPAPGDVVTFNMGGGIADHTGIVERVDTDGTIHTIEGNSSNMVARRTYGASSSLVRGFIRLG